MESKWVARKQFSIFDAAYHPGDPVPLDDLKKVPNWKKLERGGFIVEEQSE